MRCYYNQTGISAPTIYALYLYDASGNRVKKLVRTSAGTYESVSYVAGLYEYRTNGTNAQATLQVMDNRVRIVTVRTGDTMDDSSPSIKWNLDDHLGSSSVELDDNGSWVSREEYFPFGETSFGSYAKKRYRFCGKEKDSESGLYYYGMRYCAPWMCRFVGVDPLANKYPFYTPYQYAGNNPVTFFDLDGQETTENDITNTAPNGQQSKVGPNINTAGAPERSLESLKGEKYFNSNADEAEGSKTNGFKTNHYSDGKEIGYYWIPNATTVEARDEKGFIIPNDNGKGFKYEPAGKYVGVIEREAGQVTTPPQQTPNANQTPPPGQVVNNNQVPVLFGNNIPPLQNVRIRGMATFGGGAWNITNMNVVLRQMGPIANLLLTNPNIQITVLGNVAGNSATQNWTSPSSTLGVTMGQLATNRGNALRRILINRFGVNPNQISVRRGSIQSGMSSTFVVRNNQPPPQRP